jgi:hypothetical protein
LLLSLRENRNLIIPCAARMANEEDKCSGHFANYIHVVSPPGHRQADGLICSRQINWESRFKSQALLA